MEVQLYISRVQAYLNSICENLGTDLTMDVIRLHKRFTIYYKEHLFLAVQSIYIIMQNAGHP